MNAKWAELATQFDPWDVIVIGAGPAGATAARQLALDRHRVLLIEKSRHPRFKVCGGCLDGAALEVLQQIGLGNLPRQQGGVQLRRMRLANNGSTVELNLERRIGLSRSTLDAALVQESITAGATLCTETAGWLEPATDQQFRSIRLRHHLQEIVVRTKAVIVATGLARCPRAFETRACPKSRVGLGVVLEQIPNGLDHEALYMACGTSGYVGIAPLERNRLAIAAAVDPAALVAEGSSGMLVGRILRETGLAEIDGLENARWLGTPLLTRKTRPLGSHRCLLIGDAAGYVEPFTGEGIGWALQSAVLASGLVQQGLSAWHPRIPSCWQTLYVRRLARYQRRCRLITRVLLRSGPLRELAVRSLRWAPRLARSFT